MMLLQTVKSYQKLHPHPGTNYSNWTISGHNICPRSLLLHLLTSKQCIQLWLEGQYTKTPIAQHLCIWQDLVPEDLCHYLLVCPLYAVPRKRLLGTVLDNLDPIATLEKVTALLEDVEPEFSYKVALFAALATKKIQAKLVSAYAS